MKRVTKDGRLILTGRDWTEQKRRRWKLDNESCVGCGNEMPFENTDCHHKRSRGMNGCYRDDNIDNLETKCGEVWGCHRKETPI